MKPWQWVFLGTFFGLAAAAVIFLVAAPPRGTPVILTPIPTPGEIVVQISGAVKAPGVYSMPRQSRVDDAVQAAGGFSPDAAQNAVNLAAKISDGQQIVIPTLDEQATQQAASSGPVENDLSTRSGTEPAITSPIDLNTATLDELQTLPNIGPTKASEIISYRLQHGPFKKIDDIQNVPGIGPSTFDKIKDLIFVSE